ncbi:MAG: hypothetical protein K6F22_01060 [Prevotella sp.]|jgi:hypothetical protein|nr:hypothetical protein [Prevotella sp.]
MYDQVVVILREAGKTIVENPGVMTNPTLEKLNEGVKIARENEVAGCDGQPSFLQPSCETSDVPLYPVNK